MRKYIIIGIFNLLNKIELLDKDTGKVYYFKPKYPVSDLKVGDVFIK